MDDDDHGAVHAGGALVHIHANIPGWEIIRIQYNFYQADSKNSPLFIVVCRVKLIDNSIFNVFSFKF